MTTNNEQPEVTPTDESATPQTVQTVQQGQPRQAYFEVAQDTDGKWHWMLWSANGRGMATNVIDYDRQNDATTALKAIVQAINGKTIKIVVTHQN